MRSIGIIGDVHGLFDEYYQMIKQYGAIETIQIGDMGVGFSRTNDDALDTYLNYLHSDGKSKHRFFRGNHDNPAVCKEHPCHLGDWGYLKEYGIFWVAGAWSIDWEWREEGRDWWKDEELSEEVWKDIREAYLDIKPRFVLSHDAPLEVYGPMLNYYGKRIIPTRTSQELNGLLFQHQPEKWIFGHHHMSITHDYLDCEFRCLNELEVYELRI